VVRNAVLALSLLCAAWPARAADEGATVAEAAAGEAAAPAPPRESPVDEERKESLRCVIEGYLSQEARFRSAGGESDFDLYTHLDAQASRAGTHPMRARLNGRLVADAGGEQRPGDLLYDVWDRYEHDVQLRLYEGFGEVGGLLGGPLAVRGGRQFLEEGAWFHFDGVRLDLDCDKRVDGLDVTAFLGVPVRFGEQERSDAWLAGFVGRMQFTDRTRGRFEYVHVSEFFEGINGPPVDPVTDPVTLPADHVDDDLFGLSLWHEPAETVRLFGRVTLLDGDFNELHLLARWFTKDGRWAVVLEYYQLFGTLENVTNDLTPYAPMLGNYSPFTRIAVRATRRIGEDWILQGALSHRELSQQEDEGVFNHEYNQYTVMATRTGLLEGKLDLTLTANGFGSSANDVVTAGGHVDWRLSTTVDLSGGVDYALYKYDWFQDTERENVWSYSARVRWKVRKATELLGSVSFDDDEIDEYWTLAIRLVWRF